MSIAEKIKAGVELNERELRAIAYEDWPDEEPMKFVDSVEGEDHRWNREVTTAFTVDGELYALDWLRALTENGGSEFWDQPYRAKKVTRLVPVAEYVKI